MKKITVVVPVLIVVCAFGLIATSHGVRAEDSSSGQGESQTETEVNQKAAERAREQAQKLTEQRREAEQKRQEALRKAAEAAREAQKQQSAQEKEAAKQRIEAFKQRCEQRRENFKSRMETVAEALGNRSQKLDAVMEHIKTFVAEHQLTVADYDALLTEAETQKALVKSIAATALKQADGMQCNDSDTAKESLHSFNDAVLQEAHAISDYKTAIKNIVTAVRTAAKAAKGAHDAQ